MKSENTPLKSNITDAIRSGEGTTEGEGDQDSRLFASLSVGGFRIFLLVNTLSWLGQQMQFVAQGYLAYAVGGSAITLGVVNLAWGLTMVPLSFFGGAVADRIDKRVLIAVTQGLAAVAALAIAVLVVAGRIEMWHLVASGVVQGVVYAFGLPAQQAILPELVGKARLGNGVAMVSLAGNVPRIAGPAIAGFLMGLAFFGIHGAYFFMAAMFFVSGVMSLWLPPSPVLKGQEHESIVKSVVGGLVFLRSSPIVMTLVGMTFVPVMLGLPYQTLLPVFNEVVLSGSVEMMGLLYTAGGIGSLVGSLIVAWLKTASYDFRPQFVFGVLFGLAVAVFALTSDYRVSLVVLFLLGIFFQGYLTLNLTSVMANTPAPFVGRVMSIHQLTMAAMPVASFPLSALADAIGMPGTFAITGSITAVVLLAIALMLVRTQRKEGEVSQT